MKYIGVDISKKSLDVCIDSSVRQVFNNADSISQLLEEIQKNNQQHPVCIVAEASGGYEKTLLGLCNMHDMPIHIAHANKIRSYAKSKGVLAKTDLIDAKIITEYAVVMSIQPMEIKLTDVEIEIQEILSRREQLMLDMMRDKNRLDKISNPCIRKSILSHVDWLQEEINHMDQELNKLTKHVEVSEKHNLLTSVPSIGNLTACQLIANLPELGMLSHKKIAALVGVAPYNRQSGGYDGKRYIQGGRGNLRRSLYMSAISSIRFNPDMRLFYQRLIAAGKPPKVAIIAVMRKLLCVINSVVQRGSPWEPRHQHA